MNEKEAFVGGYAGILITNEEEFNQVVSLLSTQNLFLDDGNPVSKLNYQEEQSVIFKNDHGRIEYIKETSIPPYLKVVFSAVLLGNEIVEEQTTIDELLSVQPQTQEIEAPTEVEFKVTSVVPAVINSNITAFKEVIIPRVKKYANIVVTKDNYKEVKSTLSMINASSKEINSYKVKIKKQANEPVVAFENEVKEILAVYDEVVTPIKNAIKKFDDEAKEAKKNEYMVEINKMLQIAVEKGFLKEKYKDQFEFKDDWLKTTYSKKKVLEEASAVINELISLQKADDEREMQDIQAINETYKNAMNIFHLENGPSLKSYIQLYSEGNPIGSIIPKINSDIESMAKAIELEKQKIKEEVKVEPEKAIKAQEPVTLSLDKSPICDSKTGEVIGFYTNDEITVKKQENKAPGKIFKYEYTFEGDAGVIKTLATFMKVLSVLNKTFQFTGKRI